MSIRFLQFFLISLPYMLLALCVLPPESSASEIANPVTMNAHEGTWWKHKSKEILHHIAGDDVVAFFGFMPEIQIYTSPMPEVSTHQQSLIRISTAMLSQIQSEDELAFVLSHEIAHTMLGHSDYSEAQLKNGALVTESDADRLALILMRSADYDLSAASHLLKRLGAFEYEQSGITVADLHPSILERERMLQGYLRVVSAHKPLNARPPAWQYF